MAFNPAVELSTCARDEQRDLLETMDSEQTTPSLRRRSGWKKFSQEGRLNIDVMCAIYFRGKAKITFRSDTLRKYFPRSYTPQQMEQVILKLLEGWLRKRQQEQQR